MSTIKCVRYEHDHQKLATNVAQHQVWFHEAEDFDWESALIKVDDRRDYGESRFVAMGLIGERLHVMVFTFRDTALRIISLRRANKREIRRYASQN